MLNPTAWSGNADLRRKTKESTKSLWLEIQNKCRVIMREIHPSQDNCSAAQILSTQRNWQTADILIIGKNLGKISTPTSWRNCWHWIHSWRKTIWSIGTSGGYGANQLVGTLVFHSMVLRKKHFAKNLRPHCRRRTKDWVCIGQTNGKYYHQSYNVPSLNLISEEETQNSFGVSVFHSVQIEWRCERKSQRSIHHYFRSFCWFRKKIKEAPGSISWRVITSIMCWKLRKHIPLQRWVANNLSFRIHFRNWIRLLFIRSGSAQSDCAIPPPH